MSLAEQGKRISPNFEEVADIKKEETVDNNVSTEVETNEALASIISTVTNKPKKMAKRQISTYLDADVAKAFDKFGKKYGKGAKADLINNFLREALNVKKETTEN